jgi:hypothetical protein
MKAHGSRSLLIAFAALSLAGIAWSATTPANAAPITYDLVGVTDIFDGQSGTLTGNFTFDPTTTTLSAVDIFLNGPVLSLDPAALTPTISPTFTSITLSAGFYGTDAPNQIVATNDQGAGLILDFSADLGLSADPLSDSLVEHPDGLIDIESFTTGEAVPTPLPPALTLFATGLGAMCLFGWRKKRKNAAAIATT